MSKFIQSILKITDTNDNKSKISLKKINEMDVIDGCGEEETGCDLDNSGDTEISCPLCDVSMDKEEFYNHVMSSHKDMATAPIQEPKNIELKFEEGAKFHQPFDVFLNGKKIDTVFYSDNEKIDAEDIKTSLIDHDGFDPRIIVKKRKVQKSVSEAHNSNNPPKMPAPRNSDAKYAHRSGAGAHDIKGGDKAKRAKQKKEFKKEMLNLDEDMSEVDMKKKYHRDVRKEIPAIVGRLKSEKVKDLSDASIEKGLLGTAASVGLTALAKELVKDKLITLAMLKEQKVETDTNFLTDKPKSWGDDKIEQNIHDKDKEFKTPNEIIVDLKSTQKELLKKAKDLKHEDPKTAQQEEDLSDVITDLLIHLEAGTVEEFKKAQILSTTLMSPMMHKLSSLFWEFMAIGGWVSCDGKKAKSLRDYFNVVKTDKSKK